MQHAQSNGHRNCHEVESLLKAVSTIYVRKPRTSGIVLPLSVSSSFSGSVQRYARRSSWPAEPGPLAWRSRTRVASSHNGVPPGLLRVNGDLTLTCNYHEAMTWSMPSAERLLCRTPGQRTRGIDPTRDDRHTVADRQFGARTRNLGQKLECRRGETPLRLGSTNRCVESSCCMSPWKTQRLKHIPSFTPSDYQDTPCYLPRVQCPSKNAHQ